MFASAMFFVSPQTTVHRAGDAGEGLRGPLRPLRAGGAVQAARARRAPLIPLKSLIVSFATFAGVTALLRSCAGPTLLAGSRTAAYAPTFSARKAPE